MVSYTLESRSRDKQFWLKIEYKGPEVLKRKHSFWESKKSKELYMETTFDSLILVVVVDIRQIKKHREILNGCHWRQWNKFNFNKYELKHQRRTKDIAQGDAQNPFSPFFINFRRFIPDLTFYFPIFTIKILREGAQVHLSLP